MNLETIKEKYIDLKSNKKMRIYDASKEIGVSEMHLLMTTLDGKDVVMLDGSKMDEIIKDLESLGELMALTRNDSSVIENYGVYKNPDFIRMGKDKEIAHVLLLNEGGIDLRISYKKWKYAVATTFVGGQRTMHGIQFFSAFGTAVHKVYLHKDGDVNAYNALVNKFKLNDQTFDIEDIKIASTKTNTDKPELDIEDFRNRWANLKDVHDIHVLLYQLKLNRIDAIRALPKEYAYKVDNTAMANLMENSKKAKQDIMVFGGNLGCIQIYTGKILEIMERDNWFNIIQDKFNLHLNLDKISETYVVRKPTVDGILTSLELYDTKSNLAITVFSKRKEGNPEVANWAEIIKDSVKEI